MTPLPFSFSHTRSSGHVAVDDVAKTKTNRQPKPTATIHHGSQLTNDGKHLRTETGDDEPR
jgi:hypothetical protein